MDKIGPLCRTAEDCGLVLDAIAGFDPEETTTTSQPWKWESLPKEKRFRFATLSIEPDQVQPEVLANYERSLDVLRGLGTVDVIELPDLPYSIVASTIISCEMAAAFESFVRSGDVWELSAAEDRWGGYSNLVIPAKDYINAIRIRTKIQKTMDALFADCDAIVMPTLSTESGPITQRFSDWAQGFVCSEISAAANVAGLPSVTIPNGFGKRGLPTGIEFTGRAFDEINILNAAQAYQALTDWHTKRPPIA